MPIEPVKIDASKLPKEMKDKVNTLNKLISKFNSLKGLSTYEDIISQFDEIFSACQNEPTLEVYKEELKTNWNKFKSDTKDFISGIDFSTVSYTDFGNYGKTVQTLIKIDKLLSPPVESTTSKVSSSSKNLLVTTDEVNKTLFTDKKNNRITTTLHMLEIKYPSDTELREFMNKITEDTGGLKNPTLSKQALELLNQALELIDAPHLQLIYAEIERLKEDKGSFLKASGSTKAKALEDAFFKLSIAERLDPNSNAWTDLKTVLAQHRGMSFEAPKSSKAFKATLKQSRSAATDTSEGSTSSVSSVDDLSGPSKR